MTESPRTVYFLGAGASHATEFRLPLMRDLLPIKDELELDTGFADVNKWIVDHFTEEQMKNAEDVFTFIDCKLSGPPYRAADQAPTSRIQALLIRYLASRVRHATAEQPLAPAELLMSLFKRLGDRDVIVTLNYDSLIEHSLWGLGQNGMSIARSVLKQTNRLLLGRADSHVVGDIPRVSFPRGAFMSKVILHLHGWIDWMTCENPSCRNHCVVDASMSEILLGHGQPPSAMWDEKMHRECNECGSDFHAVIVPPTMRKAFQRYPFLAVHWRLAQDAMSDCDSLVVIGASLAESDFYVRWLLRSSLVHSARSARLRSIDLVANRDVEAVAERLCSALPATVESRDSKCRRLSLGGREVDLRLWNEGLAEYCRK